MRSKTISDNEWLGYGVLSYGVITGVTSLADNNDLSLSRWWFATVFYMNGNATGIIYELIVGSGIRDGKDHCGLLCFGGTTILSVLTWTVATV